MAPTPQSKALEFADQLERICEAEPLDEVAVRRIVAGANKLMRVDAAAGHELLGRVAALRWDVDEMKRRHMLSVSLGDPVLSRCNFALSLTLVGLIDEAFQIALEAAEHSPGDRVPLRVAIETALAGGRLRTAKSYVDRWRKLSPDEAAPHTPEVYSLVRALGQGLFTEDGVRDVLGVAASIRVNARVRSHHITVSESIEEPGSFLMTEYVVTPSSRAADLNCELAERWAEAPTLRADPGLRFKPMFIGTIADGDHA